MIGLLPQRLLPLFQDEVQGTDPRLHLDWHALSSLNSWQSVGPKVLHEASHSLKPHPRMRKTLSVPVFMAQPVGSLHWEADVAGFVSDVK